MKKIKAIVFIAVISLLISSGMAYGAISLSVDPASAPADTTTGFTFQTQAAEAGGRVQFELFGDFNNNGVIDGDEWAIFAIIFIDNIIITEGGDDFLTGDTDPSSPNITIALNFGDGIFPAGAYIARVQNSNGEYATAEFTLTPVSAPQTVTGVVYEQGTTTPVPNAVVYCEDAVTETFISADFTDSNGLYTLQIPTPGDIEIGYDKQGYMESPSSILTVPSDGVSNYNLYLTPANAWITGTVTEYGTVNSIWGVDIWAETIDGKGSRATTDINGYFTLPALAGEEWRVGAGDLPGYFGMRASSHNYEHFPIITPTVVGPNIVNFVAHKETAWIDGTVLDEYGTQPVEGALFYAYRTNTSDPALQNLQNGHYTNSSGQVTVGLEAGDWRVGLCMNCHEHPVLVGGVEKEMVPPSEVEVTSLTTDEHRSVELKAYYADGAIEGRVYQQDCQTPAPKDVRVSAWTDNALNDTGQTPVGHHINTATNTDANGFYRLPLLGGNWTVRAQMWDWNKQSPEVVITLNTDGNDAIDQPGETITNIDLCLNLDTGAPDISVSPLLIDFGNVAVGDISSPQEIIISNTGNADLTVTGIILAYVEDFALDLYGGTNPCESSMPTIAAGDNCTVTVIFGPQTTGEKSAELVILSDDPDEGTVYVSLTGNKTTPDTQVSATRDLPTYAAVDTNIDVSIAIDVDEANVPNGLIVNETIPSGWEINSASPAPSNCTPGDTNDPCIGEISWLFYGSDVIDRTISYNVHVPVTETIGAVRSFNGELNYNDPNGNSVTVQIIGNQAVTIGYPFNPYDTNQDWIIGDFELLNAIDDWAAGNLGDFELLDLIDFWAAGCYQWDDVSNSWQVCP